MAHPLSPDPFVLEGGSAGVLLIHGFTGAPPEMRLLGEYLNERGMTVSAPLLPGHGTTAEDLNRCQWTDWAAAADAALDEIRSRCDPVFVGGLSMGSLLALYLAAERTGVAGVMAWSPALRIANPLIHLSPVMRHLLRTFPKERRSDLCDQRAEKRIWAYPVRPVSAVAELLTLQREVRRRLVRVAQPLLVVQSRADRTVHRRSGPMMLKGVTSVDTELIWLQHSGHNMLVDGEWTTVAARTWEFIRTRGGGPS